MERDECRISDFHSASEKRERLLPSTRLFGRYRELARSCC